MNKLSVIIPTYNRSDILRRALLAYQSQTASEAISEILVVDDGSTDSTESVVREVSGNSKIPIRYFRQENKGPAAARNVGVRVARSELILFSDDDIIPGPGLVAEHIEWHKVFPDCPTAVLGRVIWAPEVDPTPFMEWYGSDGPLFAYARIEGKTSVEPTYFYTCNLSLKAEFLRKAGTFDEDFKFAAFEDVELGYRLGKAGMQLLYNRNALAYHQQHVTFADACRRSEKATLAAEVFSQTEAGRQYASQNRKTKVGRLAQAVTKHASKLAFPLLSPLRSFMDARVPLPWIVYRLMFRVFQR